MIQQMVADNEIDIAATRALLVKACWELDQGAHGGERDLDRQDLRRGGDLARGGSVDPDVRWHGCFRRPAVGPAARELRPFRIYDGPSEVHRWAIAKRAVGKAKKAAAAGGGS